MANKNQFLAQEAAVVKNPLTFTAGQSATNIQGIIDLISLEGAEQTIQRGFLDEMSPAARITLYRILTDLKAAI